jgi:co-chaperonin GroES (HSP10)
MFGDFRPVNDFVQVKLWEEDNSKIGTLGLQVPDKYQQRSNRAIVHGIGEKVTASVQIGDRIVLGIGNVEDLVVNGESFLLIREGDIRGFERKR